MAINVEDSHDLKRWLKDAGEKLVVVDFMARWCGPCKKIAPRLDEIAKKLAEFVIVLKVDVDENEVIADKYKIDTLPTFVLLKKSKKLQTITSGDLPKLQKAITKHI